MIGSGGQAACQRVPTLAGGPWAGWVRGGGQKLWQKLWQGGGGGEEAAAATCHFLKHDLKVVGSVPSRILVTRVQSGRPCLDT